MNPSKPWAQNCNDYYCGHGCRFAENFIINLGICTQIITANLGTKSLTSPEIARVVKHKQLDNFLILSCWISQSHRLKNFKLWPAFQHSCTLPLSFKKFVRPPTWLFKIRAPSSLAFQKSVHPPP